MNKWLLVILATVLVGCGSSPQPNVNFYLLPDNSKLSELSKPESVPLLIVQPVELAAYLDTQAVVYRQSETQVVQAKQNQWAQRLEPQLTQRLINDLRHKQSSYWPVSVSNSLSQSEHWKLSVRLQRFNGAYTGSAEVVGNWELQDPKGEVVLEREFSFYMPLQDTGYPALIEALSSGVDQLSNQIQNQLLTL